jgi:hypothetical protein
VAALTLLSQSQAPLSLQQHLDLAPDILNCSAEDLEGELQPLMMAQAVPTPQPPNDRRRVKVYELRNNDWFDRGTGFCTAAFLFVRCSICLSLLLRSFSKVSGVLSSAGSPFLVGLPLTRRVYRMKSAARKNLACSCSQKIIRIACF